LISLVSSIGVSIVVLVVHEIKLLK
jgi:hypothetical protein